MRIRQKRTIVILSALILVVLVILMILLLVFKWPVAIRSSGKSSTPLVDQSTLDALSKKNASAAYTGRIASSIIPPTNSWITGMVLQKTPLPVYPMPLSFLGKDTGFEIGLPTVQSAPTIITGEHTPGLTVNVSGSKQFKLTRFDKISASLTYSDANSSIGTLTLAEGSPYVFFHADKSASLEVTNIGPVSGSDSSTYLRYTLNGHDYVISTSNDASISHAGSTINVTAKKGSLVTFYSLPTQGNDPLKNTAGNELQSVAVSDNIDSSTQTSFHYETADGKPTVFVPMNYSHLTGNSKSLLTYDSIYGPMKAYAGNQFTTTVSTSTPSNQLDVSHITADHKQQLISSLRGDAQNTSITANDSYYAGKQLARAANLLDISEQLGQKDVSAHLISVLKDAFSKRLNGQYFYYDTTLKGVAAQTNAFGSQDFNDHHFHYGYFIYAASILGKYDSGFVKDYKNQVNLLVADIASYQASSSFPLERYYDSYAAHSWAAGLAPFADGNNQESSSEAVNAWNGVALWGNLINNSQLHDTGIWMLSNEQATAGAAWRSVSINAPYLQNFTSPLTSLNFGGKRTYATFFSDEPNTKLGIQLIPMSPMMKQDASDGSSIEKVLSASINNDNYNVALGDYDLMYLALANPQKALQLLPKQKDAFIDDGNSRTYLNAWVYSLTDAKG